MLRFTHVLLLMLTATAFGWTKPVALPPAAQQTVVFSPDGKLLTSIENRKTIVLLNAANGKVIRRFAGHTNMAIFVSFSPDGKQLVSAGLDQIIRLWDVATGKEVAQLKGHLSRVFSVHFHPDGKQLVSSSYDRTIRIWDIKSRKEVRQFTNPKYAIHSVAVSPSGKLAAAWGYFPFVVLIDLESTKEIAKLGMTQATSGKGYAGICTSVRFSPDGKRLVLGHYDRTIRIVDIASRKMVRQCKGHKGAITSVNYSPDGKQLISTSWDSTIRLWETMTGTQICQLSGSTGRGMNAAFSPSGKILAWGGPSGQTQRRRITSQWAGEQAPPTPMADLWSAMKNTQADPAYGAMWTMTKKPESAAFLAKQLRPVPRPDQQRIFKLISLLDSNEFAVRRQATQELVQLGELAEPTLRNAAQGPSNLEVKQRIGRILAEITDYTIPPEQLQVLRGVQTLEYIGTDQARKVLANLAGGAPGARLTREAKDSLTRLQTNLE